MYELLYVTVSGGNAVSNASAAGLGAGAAVYAGGALYGAAGAPAAYTYDDQLMRGALPHHMGGYYETGYVAREGTFGLGGGERFGRTDAASPQQYGGNSSVGGVGAVGGVGGVGVSGGGKVSAYSQQQQPPYDAQDSYKPGGAYSGSSGKAGGGAADLGNVMYNKTHVALNKVNSYEKAAFHSGTPPPFGAGSHLYIPAPPHHHPHHHAPQQHQQESGAGGGRSAASKPASSKPNYSQSYWAPN
ncbi:Protein lingerer [Papilio machaon]|uniref:Protein lingerer n=1 Tax=Papilio machaon TaxID=76193 RepID=A0A0N1ICJ7_PAPMA|nr:Protein lingerer [Papilio machaon]